MSATDFLNSLGVQVQANPATEFMLAGANAVFDKNAGVEVFILGVNSLPVVGAVIVGLFPDGNGFDPVTTSGAGRAELDFGASAAYSLPGKGPFRLAVVTDATKDDGPPKVVKYGALRSDLIDGLGDANGHHTFWSLQFVERAVITPPPILIPPTVTTPLDLGFRKLAWAFEKVDFNAEAALFKFAQGSKLGYPLSQELQAVDSAGKHYTYQLFSGGIVYVPNDNYGDVHQTSWL